MHALIIEDESLISMALQDILRDCGFTSFDTATSSEEAVRAAQSRCPALIIADVELKAGTGIEAVNEICTGSPIPVIFITGSPSEVTSRMPHYPLVGKPFTRETLMSAVRLALAVSEKASK